MVLGLRCVTLVTFACMLADVAGNDVQMKWYTDGKLRLSSTLQDNVVLQWSRPCLWGWVDDVPRSQLAHMTVTATCQGSEGCHATAKLEATEDGEWRVCLPPQPPGGPTVVAVEAHGEGGKKDVLGRVELKNVLFGDVWIASGQSNIHFTVRWYLGALVNCVWRRHNLTEAEGISSLYRKSDFARTVYEHSPNQSCCSMVACTDRISCAGCFVCRLTAHLKRRLTHLRYAKASTPLPSALQATTPTGQMRCESPPPRQLPPPQPCGAEPTSWGTSRRKTHARRRSES